jgi:hypothetical protein
LLFANKVSGIVVDKADQPVPFANIAFKDSNEGAVANEDGRFILNQLKRHFSGYFSWILDREITLGKAVSYNFKVLLREAEILNEVVILLEKHQNRQPCSGDSKKNMGKKTQKRFVFV